MILDPRREQLLRAAFGEPAPEHFEWQTSGVVVADKERALVRQAFLPLGARVLDLGCGEGATLVHLGEPAGAWGVDLFEAKARFAATRLRGCRFAQASVYELPFAAGTFDQLISRDLIHHLEEPDRFLDEAARVLARGGRIDVLEPCRYNPLILLHALTNRAERGELRSTRSFLLRTIGRRFRIVHIGAIQALPLHRVVYHPTLGKPALANAAPVRALVDHLERLAERFMPKAVHAYLHVRATVE